MPATAVSSPPAVSAGSLAPSPCSRSRRPVRCSGTPGAAWCLRTRRAAATSLA